MLVRNNHYRGVWLGPYQNLGVLYAFGVSSTTDMIPLVSLKKNGTTKAIATTTAPHGFSVGPPPDKVIISNATGADAGFYNTPLGGAVITDVTSNTFQYLYQTGGTPGGDALGTPGYATADRQRLLASLTSALQGGVYVATAQISSSYTAHGFSIGDAVNISKASRSQYNGEFTITATPDARTFQYTLPSDPGGASTSGYYGRLWQTGRLVMEDNIIELIPASPQPTPLPSPVGILVAYASFVSPPLCRQAVIRRNLIRHVDNAPDPAGSLPGSGISVGGCEDLIVEENIVDLNHPTPILFQYCGQARFFSNRTSAGELIQGYEFNTTSRAGELSTIVDDAMVMAL